MSKIIFDQLKYIENFLKNGFVGYPKRNDLNLLAIYYREQGLGDIRIRKSLLEFCQRFNPDYNEVLRANDLDTAVRQSADRSLKICNHIVITESEMEKIRSVQNYKYQKILFAMLAISKGLNPDYNRTDGKSYVNVNFGEIMRFAKVYAGRIEKAKIKHDLFLLGMLDAVGPNTKYFCNGKDNFVLFFRDDDSPASVEILDPNVLVSYFPFFCNICGKAIQRTGSRQKMCKECWDIERSKKNKTYVKKNYYKNLSV
jgi:hypothetical protein